MCNLASISWIVSAWLATAGGTLDPHMRLPAFASPPFVAISAPKKPLHVGEIAGPGQQKAVGRTVVHVVANCPYLIKASFQGFKRGAGSGGIPASHLSVAINGRPVQVGKGRAVIASSTTPTPQAGVDVPVELQVNVDGSAMFPAGRYNGVLMLTVMPGL